MVCNWHLVEPNPLVGEVLRQEVCLFVGDISDDSAQKDGLLRGLTNRTLMEPPYRGLMEPAEGMVFRVSDEAILICF